MRLIRSWTIILAWYFAVMLFQTTGADVPDDSQLNSKLTERRLSLDFYRKHLRVLQKRLALARELERKYGHLLKKRRKKKKKSKRFVPYHMRRPARNSHRPRRKVISDVYPEVCSCVVTSRPEKGTCYDFLDYDKNYCRPRPCRAKFVCVKQGAGRMQCIRRKVVRRIVSKGDGTCNYKMVSGPFYYVPYA